MGADFPSILRSLVGIGVEDLSLHYLFSLIAFRPDRPGNLVKGSARRLVKDGGKAEVLEDPVSEGTQPVRIIIQRQVKR